MRELVDAGYVRRFREQAANGRWAHVTEVNDESDSQPAPAGEPTPGKPKSVDQALIDKGTDTSNKGSGSVPRNVVLDDDGRLWVKGDDS